jgi:hypothetical protein
MSTYFITPQDPMFGSRIVRLDDDGTLVWLGLNTEDEGYLAWVAEGNEATEWNHNGNQ